VGKAVRATTFWRERGKNILVLNVPCLVLLVKVRFREGEVLESKENIGLGSGLYYEQRKCSEQSLYCVQSEF
jgi:hypothetical protein